MESGGKAVTKRYRKKITVVLSLVLPVIVLFAILNCFTTYVFYEDYKYKMNLMTVNSNPRIPFVTQESPFVNESPVL